MIRRVRARKALPRRLAVFAWAALASVNFACAPPTVRIGVSVVLTGLNSEIGVTGRNGAELAADTLNDRGGVKGRRIELLIRDDGGDAERAEEADEALVAAGAVAIVGHMTSNSGLKAIPGAADRSVPLVSPTISSNAYSGMDDYFFRTIGANTLQGIALASYAYEDLGLRRIAAAYEGTNRAYSADVLAAFRDEFTRRGGKVIAEESFASAVGFDYGPTLERMTAGNPDGLLSVAGPADNAALCVLLDRMGSELPVLAGMWSMTGDLIQLGGRSADRMVLAGSVDPDSDAPAYRSFVAEYRSRFGSAPTFASVHAYESVMLVASALARTASKSGAGLKAAILGSGPVEGLQDTFSFDRFGDAERPYKIFRVTDGRFTRVR